MHADEQPGLARGVYAETCNASGPRKEPACLGPPERRAAVSCVPRAARGPSRARGRWAYG